MRIRKERIKEEINNDGIRVKEGNNTVGLRK
jgi:hypothetical protein